MLHARLFPDGQPAIAKPSPARALGGWLPKPACVTSECHKIDAHVVRRPIGTVSVCVPAKNERERLPAFFDAMGDAVLAAMAAGVACEIVLALDGCTDGSVEYVRERGEGFPCPVWAVELAAVDLPHAGRARRAAMEAAVRMDEVDARHAMLTTDADSLVHRDWIVATVRGLAETDLVAGYVEWDDETPIAELTRQEDYFDALHRWRRRIDPVAHDAADPHHKHYGASLAARQGAYRAVGGLPELVSSEDVALCRAVRLAGLRLRQDRAVRVLTSTRRSGRASGGFSDAIITVDGLIGKGEVLRVPCPKALTRRYRAAADLRRIFEAGGDVASAHMTMVCEAGEDCDSFTDVKAAWEASPSADAFVTRMERDDSALPRVTLDAAMATLADVVRRHDTCVGKGAER